MTDFGKWLVVIGLVITVAGLVLWAGGGKWFGWVGRLPGDIRLSRDNFHFYFPIVTSLIVSVVITAILMLISWLSRK